MTPEQINQLKDNAKVLFDASAIDQALGRMAKRIEQDYQNKKPVFLVVMNGGLIFAGKLLPLIDIPAHIDYCHATRYRGEMSGGELLWKAIPQLNLKDRHVLLIDDILDEGYTLQAIIQQCQAQGAASVKTAVLIEKQHDRKAVKGMRADYCELESPDEYIFGCGMDVDHWWRNTQQIYIHQVDH